MPEHQGFIGGLFNAQCDMCGRVFKSDKLQTAWDNSKRCSDCFEMRHPQDFVRGVPDKQSTPWARIWSPVLDQSSLTSALTASGNSFTIPVADVPLFPTPNPIGPPVTVFLGIISNDVSMEVVQVSVMNTGTGVVTLSARGLRGTAPQAWAIGNFFTQLTNLF